VPKLEDNRRLYKRRDLSQIADPVLDRSKPVKPLTTPLLGGPLFVNSTGLEHAALNQFFRSPTMLARADSTQGLLQRDSLSPVGRAAGARHELPWSTATDPKCASPKTLGQGLLCLGAEVAGQSASFERRSLPIRAVPGEDLGLGVVVRGEFTYRPIYLRSFHESTCLTAGTRSSRSSTSLDVTFPPVV
jgi:hypothetical protein